MDRGEGQQWNKAPGNFYSTPREVEIDPRNVAPLVITLDQVIPPISPPATTKYIKHETIQSERLTKFWGRPMHLGAHVLLPEGFDSHPDARYPLVIFHGHFPQSISGFREEPPDPNLKPEYSERFHLPAYNRLQQEYAYQFYKEWIGPNYPRMVIIEIQHANPFYDDSYAVNSANLGPYGDAITYELIPFIEKKYRCLGGGWARFMYGGSTGGWEALAAQVFYPTEYNGCWAACPDPIDFRAYTVVNIYEDKNAYDLEGPWRKIKRPGMRNYLGQISTTLEDVNRLELVLGTKSRSGQQWDIWEAVFSPVGPDGYPKRIWDKRTGVIDPEVAGYWREHYDLHHILERDWPRIGKQLEGKINLYVGDMDNYYLNNAVYLMEEFLEKTKRPLLRGRGQVRRPGGALLERRPDAAQCDLPASLSSDVRPQDRRAATEDGPSGSRRDELEILRCSRQWAVGSGTRRAWRLLSGDAMASLNRNQVPRETTMRRSGILLSLGLFSLLMTAPGRADDPGSAMVPVGVAVVDVTPSYPIRLMGYGNRKTESEGIASPLKVRALVIGGDAVDNADTGPAVLITVDNCHVGAFMTDEVARRLQAKARIRRERLVTCATHTHCARPWPAGSTSSSARRSLPTRERGSNATPGS